MLNVSLALTLGILAGWLNSSLVVYAVLITAIVWVAQAALASQTKFKYTALRGFILTVIVDVLLVGILGFPLGWIVMTFAGIIALLFSWALYVYALRLIEQDAIGNPSNPTV